MSSAKDYKMLSPTEHVKARPDMYIGPVKNIREIRWVINDIDNKLSAEKREVELNTGLEQCVLELIVNAADHAERCKNNSKNDKVTKIFIEHTDEFISIYNNGAGIPIEKHPETDIYVPEMIFGNLLTSSNYDDTEKRTVGGKINYT